MDGTAVNAIKELAQLAAGEEVLFQSATGEEFSSLQLHRMPKELPPDEPKTLVVHSLQGLVDYIEANRDELNGADCMVHVVSPTSVRVVSKLQARAVRMTYVEAKTTALDANFFDTYRQLVEMNISLQALFEDRGDRATVLKLIGNVTGDAEVQVEDDGVSQNVTTRVGLKEQSDVPNPVVLAPYRTFREVAQPASKFILRVEGKGSAPIVGLWEADGGQWQLDAVEAIAAWLEGKVGDFAVLR